tara:strand:+ start:1487 stop:1732 length:246 start_codon:yes stop_codon:yes gene_type:complete
MLDPYRSIDLYPHKLGVQPIIYGYLLKFRPWYFDGKSVWWGSEFELRSDAEKSADLLKLRVSKINIFDGSEKNSARPGGEP